MISARRADLLAITGLVLFILVCFWPLFSLQSVPIQHDLGISDLTHNNLPMRVHLGRSLRAGSFPLWIPSIYGGYPFLAHPEAGAAYPPNLLLFGLLPATAALNLSVLLPLLIAGVSLYLFCRELELDRGGALLAAMAFAMSGFFVSHVKHLNMIGAACWLPLILLALERGVARARPAWLLLAGALFALQTLAGHPQISYYIGAAMVVYFGARLLWQRPRRPLRLTSWFLAAAVLGAGLAAVQILPTLELVSLSRRAGGIDFATASEFPYHLRDALTFLLPYTNGDPGRMTYDGTIFWENYGYIGVLPFVLALAGAALAFRRSWHARFFAIAAVAAFLLVLGPLTPIYRLLFPLVSGFGSFRFPTRYLLFVELSLAVLAAVGWTEIRRRLAGTSMRLLRPLSLAVLALALTAVDLPLNQLRQLPLVPAERWVAPPTTARALAAEPGEFRIFTVGGVESHFQAYSRARGWQGDLEPYVEQRGMLQPSSNVLWGIDSADGYVNLVPTYLASVWGQPTHEAGLVRTTFTVENARLVVFPGLIRLARLWNVRYLLTLWPTRHPDLEPLPVPSPYNVYRVGDVLPRAFVASDFVVAADDEEARRLLLDGGHDFRRTVVLHQPPPDAEAGGGAVAGTGQVTVELDEAHEVRLRVDAPGPGFLVLADTFYPGWRVEVDGRPAPLLRANVAQRAVRLGPGTHQVRFRFRSRPVLWGTVISAVSALLLVLLILRAPSPRFGRPAKPPVR